MHGELRSGIGMALTLAGALLGLTTLATKPVVPSNLPSAPAAAVFDPGLSQPVPNRRLTPPNPSQALVAAGPTVAARSIPNRTVAQPVRLEIHLRQRQLIFYQSNVVVKRYAIGIGRQGWETPLGHFRVIQKKRNPIWINPFTNESIPANDPRNPLRGYWIAFWNDGNNWIGFHGTLNDRTIGQAASHGCIHMYRQDLAELFSRVSLGTPVTVMQ